MSNKVSFQCSKRYSETEFLRKATVVVTSRPLAATTMLTAEFKRGLDQHIEIAGFNETDIQTYITLACKYNQNLLENFRFYLSSHPSILSVMYNPSPLHYPYKPIDTVLAKWTKSIRPKYFNRATRYCHCK